LCSFPVVAVVALSMINTRQEHNNVLRIRQFGDLYDRWGSPLAVGYCPTLE
jgi:hypothetical protein